MAKVEIYSGDYCPYCQRAKDLLERKGVDYTEYDVTKNPQELDKMLKRSQGQRTIPQIFIDNEHIGGCDDLYALEAKQALDALLG